MNLMKTMSYLLLLSFNCTIIAGESTDQIQQMKSGYRIAVLADKANTGWKDMSANVQMKLRNSSGDESKRALRINMLEVQNDGDKSIVMFLTPSSVKGTALLTHAHSLEANDQWQFFPALNRTKRISSQNKSGPFMGSEFAYEDMSGWELDKYSYNLLGNDTFNNLKTYKLEMIPRYENSGYTKLIAWIDEEYYRPLKIEYYDRKGSLLKTQTYDSYSNYEGFWRAGIMNMSNHLTGKSTVLTWNEYKFGLGLPEIAFEKSSLSRIN